MANSQTMKNFPLRYSQYIYQENATGNVNSPKSGLQDSYQFSNIQV